MTEIPKAAIEAAQDAIYAKTRNHPHYVTMEMNHTMSRDYAETALQAAAPHWYDPNEFAYGAGFRDGIEAAAKFVETPQPDVESLAVAIRALTPQAKP